MALGKSDIFLSSVNTSYLKEVTLLSAYFFEEGQDRLVNTSEMPGEEKKWQMKSLNSLKFKIDGGNENAVFPNVKHPPWSGF